MDISMSFVRAAKLDRELGVERFALVAFILLGEERQLVSRD
jgi:hypothetical protein